MRGNTSEMLIASTGFGAPRRPPKRGQSLPRENRPQLGGHLQNPASDLKERSARAPAAQGCELRRVCKWIAISLEGDLWLALYLMIAGRLHWRASGAKLAGRSDLAAFDASENVTAPG